MRKNKKASALLAAAMAVSTLAGTNVFADEAAQIEKVSDLYVSEEEGGKTDEQFTIWVGKTSSAADDTITQQVMREYLGIDYKCEFMQSSDVFTTVNLRLSSGSELPDMMVFPANQQVEQALVSADRVMALDDVYASDSLTNIAGIDERIVELLRNADGNIYALPGWYDSNLDDPWAGWTTDAWYINTQMMEDAGVTEEDISTIEGMEDALRKFAELKDSNGKSIIPLSMKGVTWQLKIIIATFGVDVVDSVSGFPCVMDVDGEFVHLYDNENYKKAFEWMSKMYREGLIDMEAPTMQSERLKEKVKNGQIAAWVPDAWSGDPYAIDFDSGETLDSIRLKYQPFQSPAVEGVTKGVTQSVNPYPQYRVYINKDTEHLNAVLNFLNWCADPNPVRQQEVNDGPENVNWHFTDDTRTTWEYTPEYEEARETKITGTPELWWLSNYSKEWYPWWNQKSTDERYNDPDRPTTSKACKYIAENIVNHRIIQNIDMVKLGTDSKFAEYRENLSAVVEEYQAKMLLAQSDDEFESIYKEFHEQLENRAHWSELKEEWEAAYKAQFGEA